jgi:hypothetical protein
VAQAGDQLEANVELSRHAAQNPHRDSVQMASLDQRDETCRHAGASRQLLLRPAALDPHGSERGTNALIIHINRLAATTYQLATAGLTAAYRCR